MAIFHAIATSNKFFFVATLLSVGILMLDLQSVESIGICYGQIGNNIPSAAETVQLYRVNGVTKMRLYFADEVTLNALKGSNIQLILDVSNDNLIKFATDPSAAIQWVQTNVVRFVPSVRFKYITVGNEVQPTSDMAQFVAPAMRNVNQAILSAGLHDIKVSTCIDTGVLGVSYPPSAGAFKDEAKAYMGQIIRTLNDNGAPLLVNLYPYFSYISNQKDIKLSYALFQQTECVNDRNLCYKNLFDAILDSTYYALEKEGGANVNVVVSETGWPSEGGVEATAGNAATYYRNLINHVNAAGSPKKPGPIETYLFAMYDENKKSGTETERHFGLFNPTNKQYKYQISFT